MLLPWRRRDRRRRLCSLISLCLLTVRVRLCWIAPASARTSSARHRPCAAEAWTDSSSAEQWGAMVLKYIVNRISLMALAMVLCVVGTSAAGASKKPRPVVVSTNPSDGAVDVDVQTNITVNFSLPMNCGTINKSTFRLKRVGFWDVLPRSVTCSGSAATLTPSQDLAVSTRYKVRLIGNVKAANGTKLKDGFISGFTTGPNSQPPATATPTATATSTPTSTATGTATATSTATATTTSTATATDTQTATRPRLRQRPQLARLQRARL